MPGDSSHSSRSRWSRLSLDAACRRLGDVAKAGRLGSQESGIPDDGELALAADFAWAEGDDGRRVKCVGTADWGLK